MIALPFCIFCIEGFEIQEERLLFNHQSSLKPELGNGVIVPKSPLCDPKRACTRVAIEPNVEGEHKRIGKGICSDQKIRRTEQNSQIYNGDERRFIYEYTSHEICS